MAVTEEICVYCNGMLPLNIPCPACGTEMIECGTLQEELGPYAPFEENSLLHMQTAKDCVHKVFCPTCDLEYNYSAPVE